MLKSEIIQEILEIQQENKYSRKDLEKKQRMELFILLSKTLLKFKELKNSTPKNNKS